MQLCISKEDYKIQYFKDLIFSVLFCLLPAITYLLAMERVLCAVLATIEHISLTTTDGSVCGCRAATIHVQLQVPAVVAAAHTDQRDTAVIVSGHHEGAAAGPSIDIDKRTAASTR